MHGDTLAARGPHRCAAFPFTIEIETAPKSLFFPKFQHVSVGPASNVGTAVRTTMMTIGVRIHDHVSYGQSNNTANGHDTRAPFTQKDRAMECWPHQCALM